MNNFTNILNQTLFLIDNIEVSTLLIFQIVLPVLFFYISGRILLKYIQKKIPAIKEILGKSSLLVEILLRLITIAIGISFGFKIAGIEKSVFKYLKQIVFYPLFNIGVTEVSFISISLLLIIISSSIYVSQYFIRFLTNDVYPKTKIDIGLRSIINSFIKYLTIVTGVVIGLQVNGINLSVFATIGAGLMVGVGFGLQNIASNFISGIVILLERPVKVGDYIEINGTYGMIYEINARSTTVKTRENIILIIPNSKFISEIVTNWSYNNTKVKLNIPIGISYGEDPSRVKELLMELALDNESILPEPLPQVLLKEYGNSSVNMEIEVWIVDISKRFEIVSDVNYAIYKKFKENGITIPFPQLDVHMKN